MNAAVQIAVDQFLCRVRRAAAASPASAATAEADLDRRMDGFLWALKQNNQQVLEAHAVDLSAYLARLAATVVRVQLEIARCGAWLDGMPRPCKLPANHAGAHDAKVRR